MTNEVAAGWVPAACTLPTMEQPLRQAEFDDLFRSVLRSVDRCNPMRLVLSLEAAPGQVEAVRDLIGRESACCSFFTFDLTEHDGQLVLEVVVPPAHVDVLNSITERAVRVSGLAMRAERND
ncbi:MAG: hypothetical protein H0W56_12435 [Acidothermales bacterium]|jgi:hypothetical protein|nr:hypothetical protein [Acidothermales bacterium]